MRREFIEKGRLLAWRKATSKGDFEAEKLLQYPSRNQCPLRCVSKHFALSYQVPNRRSFLSLELSPL